MAESGAGAPASRPGRRLGLLRLAVLLVVERYGRALLRRQQRSWLLTLPPPGRNSSAGCTPQHAGARAARRAAEPTTSAMAALADLQAALSARNVEDAVRIFTEMQAAGAIDADTRALAALATLAARNRHNDTAWAAYEHGKSSAGTREMRGAGLNFNAVLYACCRDPAMCEKALSVWDDMAEQGVPPELEPMSKLMLSCLARGRFDDGFRIFLAAIDANVQPGAQVCCALLRTCGVAPRLATMAYAVFVTMKNAGSEVPADVALTLLRGCLKTGTLEQAFDVYDTAAGVVREGAPPPSADAASELALRCAQEAQPARGAALLKGLTARGARASAAAYGALVGSYCRLSLARSNPSHAAAAHALVEEMDAASVPHERAHLAQVVPRGSNHAGAWMVPRGSYHSRPTVVQCSLSRMPAPPIPTLFSILFPSYSHPIPPRSLVPCRWCWRARVPTRPPRRSPPSTCSACTRAHRRARRSSRRRYGRSCSPWARRRAPAAAAALAAAVLAAAARRW